jgi:hypothetical protein
MFISNKYSHWYYNIISNAQTRELPKETYIEKHHIIPKSLGGSNKKENIANLTAREHLICHLLLIRITSGDAKSKMACAAMRMMFSSKTHNRCKVSSRTYEFVRTAVALSKKGKTGYKHTDEAKEKISISKLGKSRIFTEEWRANISRSQQGLKKSPCSDERKQKISISQKGIPRGPQSVEHRRKVSESKKGKRIHVDKITGRRYMA